MSGETQISVTGNLTGAPELRFIPSGAAVAEFTVASTPRTFDRQANEFRDGDTLFMPVKVWREQAEHIAESLDKGMRVVVTGRLTQENWEDRNGGGKRSRMVLQADDVAPSLRYATAKVTRTQRQDAGQAPQRGGQSQAPDPWATQPAAGYDDSAPPF